MIFHYDPMASPPLRVNQKSPGTQPTYRPGTEVCPEGILEKNQGMKDSGFQAYPPHIIRQERAWSMVFPVGARKTPQGKTFELECKRF
jgi:hypothetical protein